jgi:hypothetical protein
MRNGMFVDDHRRRLPQRDCEDDDNITKNKTVTAASRSSSNNNTNAEIHKRKYSEM